MVSIAQLTYFVRRYTEYCVVILPAPRTVGQPVIGRDWTDKKKILYLFFDAAQEHYAVCGSKTNLIQSIGRGYEWCDDCFLAYSAAKGHPECDIPVRGKKRKLCECGLLYTGKHLCGFKKCSHCQTWFALDMFEHRCPLFRNERSDKRNRWMNQLRDGFPALLAYDFESRFEEVRQHRELIQGFETTEDGIFTGRVTARNFMVQRHVVDLIRVKVCFTGEEKRFESLEAFINWIFSFNDGYVYAYAHNGSGYDTRMIFSELSKRFHDKVPQVIMAGNKIMRMTIGNVVFGDTMKHLPGRLKDLAESFNCPTKKGLFPYLFNNVDHIGYVGAFPGLEWFDASGCKDNKEWEELKEWHAENSGREYDLEKEKDEYCRDDVLILCDIMEKHHASMMQLHGLTPWTKCTTPGFITEVVGIELTK